MRVVSSALPVALLMLRCTPSPAPSATTVAPNAVSSVARGSAQVTDTFPTKNGELHITPIFHASVLLEVAGQAVYVDPFSKGDFSGLPKADVLLITDVHFDHLDSKAIHDLAKPETRIVVPPAGASELKDRSNLIVLENGQKYSLGLFDVEAVPMYNLARGPEAGKLFHDKGRGNGYVLTFGDKRVYLSGDTECTPEMKALSSIDVAFVCMNLPYTMPPKEAATCINAFRPRVLFPYHYGVPGGATSHLDELKSAIDPQAGVEVRVRRWY